MASQAFGTLVERQDQPTIERKLTSLLTDDAKLRTGEVGFLNSTPLDWLCKINADFAWSKLMKLRERALCLGLDCVVTTLTGVLVQMDKAKAANVVRLQLDITPPAWRHYYQAKAVEDERAARIEQAQRSPFEGVLRKLRGSTSANRLLVVCEGSSDEFTIRALLAQVADVPEVLFDFVGGWPALPKKDPQSFLRGAKEAIVVMDADNGRNLNREDRPYTEEALQQEKRLQAVGVDLRVLRRYGIENYFPRHALEAVLQQDLTAYSLLETEAIKKNVPVYSKSRNAEVVGHISLERDLVGTDLHDIIHEIAQRARRLSEGD